MNAHVGDSAELLALGLLDANEARAAQAHAASCDTCAERLERARQDVATIESARAQVEAPASLAQRLRSSVHPGRLHRWTVVLAAAAAFAVALIPSWVAIDSTNKLRTAMNEDEQALARIAAAPTVERATFMSHGRPMGRVLYGAHGDWYYVVLVHPSRALQVAYVANGRIKEMLGTIALHGASGTLYLPANHRMDELAIMDGPRIIADAHLVY